MKINKMPLAGAFASMLILFASFLPAALGQQASWSAWQSLGDSVSVSFSQVNSTTWTWKFRNDGAANITYMDFNYTDSTGQNYDVFPGTLSPGQAMGGWAAFTSSGQVTSIQLKTVTFVNSSSTAGNATPTPQPIGGSQTSPTQQTPPATPEQKQVPLAAQEHIAAAHAYQAEGQAVADAIANATADFQADLTPYGRWMDLNGQMYWQPNDATVGGNWRPYADNGNWVYTDAGWTWNSGYQWGWAPFHYGRWADDPVLGWIWQPGSVWAPAWVAWRGNDTYAGWAPLPPGSGYEIGYGFMYRGSLVSVDFNFGLGPDDYCFISISDMCQPNYLACQVPVAQIADVYRQTAVVQKAYMAHAGQFINAGIPMDRVRAVTHQDLKPLKLGDAGSILEKGTRGNTLSVYRPRIGVIRSPGSPTRANLVMDDLLAPGSAAPKPAPARAMRASDVMDDLLNSKPSASPSRLERPAHASNVMDDLLSSKETKPAVTQKSPAHASDVMDDLLSSGSPTRKPIQGTAHDSDHVIDSLLSHRHDMPVSNIRSVSRPIEQPEQTYRQPAQSYQQPGQSYQPPQQTYQQPAQTYQAPQQNHADQQQLEEQRQRQQEAEQERQQQAQERQQQLEEQRQRQQDAEQERQQQAQERQQQLEEQRQRQQDAEQERQKQLEEQRALQKQLEEEKRAIENSLKKN